MLKKILATLALTAALAACGPSQQPPPPADQPVPPPVDQPVAPPPPAPAPEPAPAPAPAHHYESSRERERPPAPPAAEPVRAAELPPQTQPAYAPPPAPVCQDCGVIATVEQVKVKGQAGMLGTLGGAAAGGLAGAQFGNKSGKLLMGVGGAIAGAFAGRAIQSNVDSTIEYRVTVNMDDGSQRTVTLQQMNGLGVGTKVKVISDTGLVYNG